MWQFCIPQFSRAAADRIHGWVDFVFTPRAIAVAGGLVLALRGQVADDQSRFQLLEHVGLPAIDEGLILRDARLRDRPGASGLRFTPGRVVVRFRDEAGMPERRAAVRAASGTGEIATRSSYADFDIVRIDPSEDAEQAAAILRERPEVQYAQVSHRVHALRVPNDPLYLSQQWNLPMINIEKAWDIQPQAGSTITVAVIDTGMAYQNATITANLPAFRTAQAGCIPPSATSRSPIPRRRSWCRPPARGGSRRTTSSTTRPRRSISTDMART
jgi:hypothetical protein